MPSKPPPCTKTQQQCAIYSDGSRLDDGCCGYAAVTQLDAEQGKWKNASAYIGENKEAYDAAGLDIALSSAVVRTNPTGCVRIFIDAQAALK